MSRVLRTLLFLAASLGLAAAGPALAVVVVPDTIVGVTSGASPALFTVLSNDPSFARGFVWVTGLQGGESIKGIDFRPLDGVLYAVGSTGRLYTIDTDGKATPVGTGTFPLSGGDLGMDFNTTDTIRVVGVDGTNFSLSPTTGVATPGTDVAYSVLDPNNGTTPAMEGLASLVSGTTYGIDTATASVVLMPVPATGVLQTVGSLGATPVSNVGFDMNPTGTAYAAFRPAVGEPANLYTVDLTSGAATLVGPLFQPAADIAVVPATGYSLRPVITANEVGAFPPAAIIVLLAALLRRRRGASA